MQAQHQTNGQFEVKIPGLGSIEFGIKGRAGGGTHGQIGGEGGAGGSLGGGLNIGANAGAGVGR